ncbi:MAG: hypothetical protein IPG50_18545 [Myxococcales bacterium]|nr:hypothetical protein [Myxococcales bacterium]
MNRRTVTRSLVALAVGGLALVGASQPAAAQEIQITGPLAGAPAVRKLRLHREGRFEVAPAVSFTLLDEYRRTLFAGGRLQYNVKDWLGIGVWGAFGALQTTTDLTDQIDKQALRNSRTASNVSGKPGADQFKSQVGQIDWVAAPQVQFVPFRGKLSLFQNIFVDTDAYLHLGVAFAGVKERGDCGGQGQPLCTTPQSFTAVSRTAVAPTFGLGLNFYTGNLVSIGIEYRALPFSWNRGGFDSRGAGPNGKYPNGLAGSPVVNSEDRTFKFNQMVTLAVGFSLPTKPKSSD